MSTQIKWLETAHTCWKADRTFNCQGAISRCTVNLSPPPPTPVNVATCERQRAANVHVVVVELNLAWESGWLQHGRDRGVFLDLRGVRHGCVKHGRGGDMADVSLPPLARCWGWPRHVVPPVGIPKWRRSGRLAGLGLGFRPTQQWRGGADQQAGAGDACGRVLLGQRPRGKRKSFFVFRNSNDLLLIIKIIFFAMKIRVKKSS